MPPRTDEDLGTLETVDDRPALRFERLLAHSPERVWNAITDPRLLADWFPAIVQFELTPGAKLRFGPTPEQRRRFGMPELAPKVANGEVIAVDPPHLLEYRWGEETLRWELTPDGDHGCRLVFTNVIDDPEAAPAVAAGWHAGLEVVEAQLDGISIDWSSWDRAAELQTPYDRAMGAA